MIATPEAVSRSNGQNTNPLLEKVSASRLNTFHQCRLKFYFRYVLKLVKPKSPALHVGSTIHAVLQFWNKARWRKETISQEKLQDCFSKSWTELQVGSSVNWEDSEAEEKETARKTLETYLAECSIPQDERPEGVEVKVEAPLKEHGLPILVGIMDLVRPGGLIVDYKTVGQTPNPDKLLHLHETQLSCYGILYREATGNKERGFELHNLVKLKTPKVLVFQAPPMTQKQETRLFRSIESFLEGIQRQDWVPSPSPMSCACCEFYKDCRAWH
jgi:CRISPR/Cas system-associated exonuclease Cas4 (RecB family)